ncbi:MAG TPA: MBG domain-containing protein [Methylibium sp.]|uniref:beta strand repeat-containing protein n=1 Tax=Methylibium sp. TaxID=2067992 RepID=UPI002DB56DE7|nr:MBG domain-containing protein [Methylibium sp.]HEU4460341.1 MBG domain-containing protein [Methylibium sp.]
MYPRRRFALLPLVLAIAQGWVFESAVAQTLPAQGTVAAGQAGWQTDAPGRMTVQQHSQRAVIDWQAFSVGAGAQLDFRQPNAQAAVLNRVSGAAGSEIAGRITANGQFFLVNPNGIQLTPTGAIQAPGIVLSTLDLRNDDFMAGGALHFEARGAAAAVTNHGVIAAAGGGFAALIGGRIANDGRIEVPLGRVALGAGQRATLDLNGNGLLQVALPGGTADDSRALIDVAGRISADGGRIEIAAATARDALRHAVNLPGELQARSVGGRSGDIVLAAGDGGSLSIGGRLDASGHGAGERGGAITATGARIELAGARLDASGAAGGGRVRIGGDREGAGTLVHAQRLAVDAATRIDADASVDGHGGDLVLWSDEHTAFAGTLSARGAGAGRGGEAEVSSRGLLAYDGHTDLRAASAAPGSTGTLLLDPRNVTISTGANTGAGFTAAADNTVINTTTLATALATANVTVSTGNTGTQAGNITVANPVTWSGGTTLTLQAAGSINSNAALTASAGGGVTMNAGQNISIANGAHITGGGGAVMNIALNATGTVSVGAATLATGGGSLVATGTAAGNGIGVRLNGSTLNVGSGTGTITGVSPSGYGISLDSTVALSASGAGSIGLAGTLTTSSGATLSSGLQINGSLTTAGSVNGSGTGVGGSGHGLVLRSGAALTSSGALSLQGSAVGTRIGVSFIGNNAVTANSGSLAIAGSSVNAVATLLQGMQTLNNPGGGSFSVIGISSNNTGMQWSGTTATLSGPMSFTGHSASATGFYWAGASTVSLLTGSVSFAGHSTTTGGTRGMWFNDAGNSFVNQGAGSLGLAGTTASTNAANHGLGLGANVALSTTGTVGLSGSSTANAYGVYFASANALQANGGALSVTGSSVTGTGLRLQGGAYGFTAAAGASIALAGSASGVGNGVWLADGASLAGSGSVSLAGSTAATVGATVNRYGVLLGAGTSVSTSGGTLDVHGSASGNAGGLYTTGNLMLTQGGTSSLALGGTSASGPGVRLGGGTLTTQGTLGITSIGARLLLEGETVVVAAGSLAITSSAAPAGFAGISIKGAVAFDNAAGGSLGLVGGSASYRGIELQTGASLAVNGPASLSGSSSSGTGLYIDAPITVLGGALSLSGSSTLGTGVAQTPWSAITNQGGGTLAIAAPAGGMSLGNSIASSAGVLTLSGAGAIAQNGSSAITAGQLLLGGSAAFALTGAGNQIGTVAGTAGTLDLYSAGALTVGSVLGQHGIATTGQPIVRSGQALVIAGGAAVFGASPVLAAGTGFTNLAGSAAVVASSGRWLVYAAAPASSSFGGLDSGHTALWNATHASTPPTGVVDGGHRYLFASQPTLVFTATDAVKLYGTDAVVALQASYGISGYATGVTNAFLADTAATAYSGAPSLTSAGTDPAAGVAGGPYAITVSQGSVAGLHGYATAFTGGSAQLSVTARPITVAADAQSRVYGDANPALTARLTRGSLVNGDALSGVLATAADATSSVGSYAITQGSLGAGANYALSYAPASLSVTRRPITLSADAQTRAYGDANPALTGRLVASSLVNGDAWSGALATAAERRSDVGAYAITAGSLSAGDNYLLQVVPATLAVTPRALVVSALPVSRLQGEPNPALGWRTVGLVDGDRVSGALAVAAHAASPAGAYVIGQGTLAAGGNYALAYEPGLLVVTPMQPTVRAEQERAAGPAATRWSCSDSQPAPADATRPGGGRAGCVALR